MFDFLIYSKVTNNLRQIKISTVIDIMRRKDYIYLQSRYLLMLLLIKVAW